LKIGHSTRLTDGVCDGIKMYCHWSDTERTRYVNGNRIKVAPEVTEEYVVVSQRSHQRLEQDWASEPGDSGSLIIDNFGRICGLLYIWIMLRVFRSPGEGRNRYIVMRASR
jgi:hypothetical protein